MKIKCQGLELSETVSKVIKALPIKRVNPILDCVKITAKNDELILLATDLDLWIEKRIKANVLLEGEIVVPGKIFAEYCKKIEEEEIELDGTEKNRLKIRYLDSEVSLSCGEVGEYPELKKVSEEKFFKVGKKDFRELINKIIFNVATDESRPPLKGCCLNIKGNVLEGVASDGYRLALATVNIENNEIEEKIVVPSRSMLEMSRLIEDDDSEIALSFEKHYIMLDLGHTKVVTRLIADNYIAYERIIPSEFTTEVVVDKKQFENAIDRVSLISRNEKKSYVKMEVGENQVLLKAESETGEINEKVQIALKGKDIVIAFNSKYIIDAMRAIQDQYITLNFTSPSAPGIIKGQDKSWLYLILPLRVIG